MEPLHHAFIRSQRKVSSLARKSSSISEIMIASVVLRYIMQHVASLQRGSEVEVKFKLPSQDDARQEKLRG